MILISACLLGRNVKYSGGNNLCPWLAKYYNAEDFTVFCPECLAMLPIPRPPVEIQNGSGEDVLNGKACVKDKTGLDVTREFLSGAQKALQIAKNKGANYAGTFSGGRKCGNGVAAELLMQHGIKVYTEETITEEELIKILRDK